jgi:hypothetical protein
MSFLINPFAFAVAGGDFESIATVTVGSGGAASIEFTSIPATFAHLQVRYIARSSGGTTGVTNLDMQFNSDTGSNYAWHQLYGTGSAAAANANSSKTSISVAGRAPEASTTASVFGGNIIDILDYANTSKATTMRSFHGADTNGGGIVVVSSGLWTSTAAVTSIKLFHGSNFAQHTTAALFGVKAP